MKADAGGEREKRMLIVGGVILLFLYCCLYVFHWAAVPIDPGIHRELSARLDLKAFPGAMVFKQFLSGRTTATAVFTTIGSLLLLFYFLSLRWVRRARGRDCFRIIVFFIALFGTLHLLFYPWLSTDVFHYGFIGKCIRVHAENPCTATVVSTGEDAYERLLHWKSSPSPYGPLSMTLYAAIHLPGGDIMTNAWAAKLLALAFFFATVSVIARAFPPARRGYALLLAGWSPLALIEGVANAHLDMQLSFFLALSAFFALRGRNAAAMIALTASALVKPVTIILIPCMLVYIVKSAVSRGKRYRDIPVGVGVSLLLAGLCYWPFWEGSETFAWVGNEIGLSARSFHWMLREIWNRWEWPLWFLRGFCAVALFCGMLFLCRKCRTPQKLVKCQAILLLFYLIFCCFFNHPWYLIWAAPLVALIVPDGLEQVFLAYTATAFLGYYPFLYYARGEGTTTLWQMALVTLTIPALLLIRYLITNLRSRVTRSRAM